MLGQYPLDVEARKLFTGTATVGPRRLQMQLRAQHTGKGMESIGPSVYAKVLSASSFGDESSTATLDVQDYGTISANSIDRIR